MKNKIAIASAFIAASSFSFAEIALTENFSVEGFVNTQYSDGSGAVDAAFDLEEVEISFLFDSGPVSAQIDVDFRERTVFNAGALVAADGVDEDGNLGDFLDTHHDADIDQAFINYEIFGGVLSAGLIDSQLGYEAFEAPGLYTNSTAYRNAQLPGTDEAVKFTKQLDEVSSIGVALLNANNSFIGDESGTDTVIEIAYGRDLGNGFGAFVGYRSDDANDNDLINAYVTYETGAMTYAVELVDGENTTDLQLLANYAYAANASVTVRYTQEEDGLAAGDDLDIVTLAHQLALADNLSLTTEFQDNGNNEDEHQFSVSLLFTF